MEERKIILAKSDPVDSRYGKPNGLEKVNTAFVTKNYLKEEDIEEMSRNISDHILKELRKTNIENDEIDIIISVLQPYEILNFYAGEGGFFIKELKNNGKIFELTWKDENKQTQSEKITIEEIEPYLEKIRTAIIEKLSSKLPKNILIKVIKKLNHINNSAEIEGGIFLKGNTARREREYKDRIKAIKILYEIKERNPFVYYGLTTIDPQNGQTLGKIIELTTIEEALKDKLPLSKILKYFKNIIDGHIFLLSNNLILFDNNLSNLGINKKTDTGILFDFDGLRKTEDSTSYAHATRRDCNPPERCDEEIAPAEEKNIVYELGAGLIKIIDSYEEKEDTQTKFLFGKLAALRILATEMTKNNKEDRPNLKEVKEEIKSLID